MVMKESKKLGGWKIWKARVKQDPEVRVLGGRLGPEICGEHPSLFRHKFIFVGIHSKPGHALGIS